MTVIEYCRHETKVHELVIIREGGYERCVAYIDYEDLFRLPPDIAHADVIDSSRDHIKVLDHQDAYVIVPCTCLDIKWIGTSSWSSMSCQMSSRNVPIG